MHCREALIAFASDLAGALDAVDDPPKAADFKSWAEIAAEKFAGERRLRAYLKALATHAWDLSVWLQHHGSAGPWNAEVVLNSTEVALSSFSLARIRNERGAPPRCQSYRVESDGGIEHDEEPYVQWKEQVCGACEHRWDHHFVSYVAGDGWTPTDWVAPKGA